MKHSTLKQCQKFADFCCRPSGLAEEKQVHQKLERKGLRQEKKREENLTKKIILQNDYLNEATPRRSQ